MDTNTTLNQLAGVQSGGIGRLITMIGAKNFIKSDEKNTVAFKFMRGATNKANHIRITLNSLDTYDVEYIKIHGVNFKTISEFKGLYDDMIHTNFLENTGFALSL